jgi:hypothetical protein
LKKRKETSKSSQDIEEITSLEGIDMEETRIETTNQTKELLCPKAGTATSSPAVTATSQSIKMLSKGMEK